MTDNTDELLKRDAVAQSNRRLGPKNAVASPASHRISSFDVSSRILFSHSLSICPTEGITYQEGLAREIGSEENPQWPIRTVRTVRFFSIQKKLKVL